jgi:hypothetical protein
MTTKYERDVTDPSSAVASLAVMGSSVHVESPGSAVRMAPCCGFPAPKGMTTVAGLRNA